VRHGTAHSSDVRSGGFFFLFGYRADGRQLCACSTLGCGREWPHGISPAERADHAFVHLSHAWHRIGLASSIPMQEEKPAASCHALQLAANAMQCMPAGGINSESNDEWWSRGTKKKLPWTRLVFPCSLLWGLWHTAVWIYRLIMSISSSSATVVHPSQLLPVIFIFFSRYISFVMHLDIHLCLNT
jgi:hypothetical protein